MRLCVDRFARISSDSLEISGPPFTHQESRSSTEASTGNPTENNIIVIGIVISETTVITKTDMPPGTSLEVVAVEASMLEGLDRTEITAVLWVRVGDLVTITPPPPPTRTDRISGKNFRDIGR